jgi:glycerol-3-phosphate acyltransferase PlsY
MDARSLAVQGAALVVGWLVGSFPTAYLVGRANGVDLRTVGSGNLGATNVLRSIGKGAAALVYVVDALKGALPVLLGGWVIARPDVGGPAALPLLCGIAAIIGHVRPVFLRGGGGGKGVATASGVFLALAPLASLLAIAAFVATTALTRYVSLGSLVAAVVLPAAAAWRPGMRSPVFAGAALVGAFVWFTHRENLARLRAGTERRLGAPREVRS